MNPTAASGLHEKKREKNEALASELEKSRVRYKWRPRSIRHAFVIRKVL